MTTMLSDSNFLSEHRVATKDPADVPEARAAAAENDRRLGNDACDEILHGLNNVLVSVLLNAQIIECKMPTYSRVRRHLHEIERNAQRGGELVKRLMNRLSADSEVVEPGAAETTASADPPPPVTVVPVSQVPSRAAQSAECKCRASQRYRKKVPHTMV